MPVEVSVHMIPFILSINIQCSLTTFEQTVVQHHKTLSER